MGVIDVIAVDPDYQRRGVASQLTAHTRPTICGGAEWISRRSKPAAIPATRPARAA